MMENKTDFFADWYGLWMEQSKKFFESANEHVQESIANPEAHLKQINDWLESLKKQWEFMQLSDEQKVYQTYWNLMRKMCNDASDMMLGEWLKRTREDKPLQNIHELYELWLQCSHAVYQQSIQTKAYQDAYAEFINTASKLFKTTMTTK